MSDEQKIFLGLGSNIDDRYYYLKSCMNYLDNHPHIWITDRSYIYQSKPMYYSSQDDYYNMVIKIETNLNPVELLMELKIIENKLGRVKRNKKNMPREIDIDILVYGDMEIDSNILTLPHPCISERAFVLKPWNDIAPNFIINKYNQTVNQMLNDIKISNDISMLLLDNGEGLL